MWFKKKQPVQDAPRQVNPNTCAKCPNRYNPNGCPSWIDEKFGFKEQHEITKEERVVTGCFYQVIPKLMIHLVKACNETTASSDKARNTVAALATLVPIAVSQGNMRPVLINAQGLLQLEDQSKG